VCRWVAGCLSVWPPARSLRMLSVPRARAGRAAQGGSAPAAGAGASTQRPARGWRERPPQRGAVEAAAALGRNVVTGQGLGPQDEARPERNAGNAFQASSTAVSEAFSILTRPTCAEIDLCQACSGEEAEDGNAPGQARPWEHSTSAEVWAAPGQPRLDGRAAVVAAPGPGARTGFGCAGQMASDARPFRPDSIPYTMLRSNGEIKRPPRGLHPLRLNNVCAPNHGEDISSCACWLCCDWPPCHDDEDVMVMMMHVHVAAGSSVLSVLGVCAFVSVVRRSRRCDGLDRGVRLQPPVAPQAATKLSTRGEWGRRFLARSMLWPRCDVNVMYVCLCRHQHMYV
jgi:hypothetical protein